MPRPVRHADDFEIDVEAQVAWVLRERGRSWIAGLLRDIEDLEAIVSVFPGAGREVERKGTEVIRRLPLKTTPFIAWYAYDEARRDSPVMLYRLFHRRQKRP